MQVNIKDAVSLNNTKREITDQGFMVIKDSRISRTGIQEYYALELGLTDREPTSIVRLYRPPEQVFDKASMASFLNVPVTDDHPPEMITAKNARQYSRGFSGDANREDGKFLVADTLTITDAELVQKIVDGKAELSNGYTSEIDFTPGLTPDGEKYDAIQTDIIGNHVAVVERGRCGPSCRVSDSDRGDITMAKAIIDGVEYEVTDQVMQAVGKLQTQIDDAEESKKTAVADKQAEIDSLQAKLDDAEKDKKKAVDTIQAKLDDAEKNKVTPEMLDELIDKRSAVIAVADKAIEKFDAAGKTCEEIRHEVVAAELGDDAETLLKDKSAEYILARFDAIADRLKDGKSTKMEDAMRQNAKTDDNKEMMDSDKARQGFIDKNKTRFKQPGQQTSAE